MAKRKKPKPSSDKPTRKRLGKNELCPCGSGRSYGRCCYDKDFEFVVDDDGNIFKAVPMSEELAGIMEEQKRKFIDKYGHEPGPDDHVFFDAPPLEHAEHFMVEAMKQAGLDPAIIYAFEKTGLIVTEANQNLISDVDRAEWEAAVMEFRDKQGDVSEEDAENEWF
jgi:hypothetical protein